MIAEPKLDEAGDSVRTCGFSQAPSISPTRRSSTGPHLFEFETSYGPDLFVRELRDDKQTVRVTAL